MNKLKKLAAALSAVAVAASLASCGTPTIGSGSSVAVTIDGYDINAGIFIFYIMQSYSDAQDEISEETGATPSASEVEDSEIDGVDATTWIQDKATQYCSDFVAIERVFDEIGGELSDEDLDEIDTIVSNVVENDSTYNYVSNGIGEDSLYAIASISYKSDYIFNYYYGFEGEKGMSEDELKEYFDNNFARVKYVSLSYLDEDGNKLDESGKKEIRTMADEYAERINSKSTSEEKLYEMDAVIEDYDEYVEEQSAVETEDTDSEDTDSEEAVTTTTVTTTDVTETTTTTTTDPHANEKLIQKVTTAVTEDDDEAEAVTETTTQSSSDKLKEYIFNDLTEYDKAVVFDDEENDYVYVVIRADLNERLTEDDLWTEDNIESLLEMNFNEDFVEYMKEISDSYDVKKNNSAYRRYKPFDDDIVLE
jgi:hypothetical protein